MMPEKLSEQPEQAGEEVWKILRISEHAADGILTREMLVGATTLKCSVDWAEGYDRGLEKLSGGAYKIVLVDYDLGARTGLELIREAVERGFSGPLILVTGEGSPRDSALEHAGAAAIEREAMRAGATMYLTIHELNPLMLEHGLRFAVELNEKEISLRASEARYRDLVEMSPDGIAIQQDGTVVFVNPAGARMLGASSSEPLIGRHIQEFVHPAFWQESQRRLQRMLQGEPGMYPYETVYVRLDGTPFPVEVSAGRLLFQGRTAVQVIVRNITQGKQIETELHAAQESLRLAIDAGNIGLWDWDMRANRVYYSREWKRQIGYEEDEVSDSYQEWVSRIHPDDRERILQLEQAYLRKPWPDYKKEFRFRHRDGTYRWILAQASIELDERGQPQRLRGSHIDITERKRAEEELREAKERAEASEQAARLLAARQASLAQLSQLLAEATTQFGTLLDTVAWQVAGLVGEGCVIRLFDEGTPAAMRAAAYHPDAATLARVRAALAGEPAQLDAQMMERVSQWVEPLINIFTRDGPNAGVPGGVIQAWLGHYAQFTSVRVPLRAQGQTIGVLISIRGANAVHSADEISFLQDVTSRAALAIANARLLQQVRRQNAELEQRVQERTADLHRANAELARASRAKDDFLANMSHELRTPLNAILTLSESLEESVYGALNERQLQRIRTIQESGEHLLNLINDVLDVAKIEAGKVEPLLKPVEVGALCEASLRLVKQLADKKRLHVSLRLDPKVPRIVADQRYLKQMLVNLLSNAVKFTPTGGRIGLEVQGLPEKKAVQIRVWDTGIGIEPDQLPHLFQPFVQVDSGLARRYEGTGLGLAIVSSVVKLHGGSVTVTSEPGQGSAFIVTLPVNGPQMPMAEPEDRVDTPAAVEEPGPASAGGLDQASAPGAPRRPLLLLAEDNQTNAKAFSIYLTSKGYQVAQCGDGVQAVAMARQQRPDLILMDIQMPVMDGLEAIRRLRADPSLPRIPIVALTALTMPGDQERCLQAGADEYLVKPVGLKMLAEVIERLLAD